MSRKKEYGDFQTPLSLARRVAALIGQKEKHYGTIIEPTCGVGAFLEAAAERFGTSPKYLGFDINPDYVGAARAALARIGPPKGIVQQRDFYTIDWKQFLSEQAGPVLIIGNPPWITNAGMGVINGKNLPEKSNFQGQSGLDAMTGKANFDISEWMLVKLAEAFPSRGGRWRCSSRPSWPVNYWHIVGPPVYRSLRLRSIVLTPQSISMPQWMLRSL